MQHSSDETAGLSLSLDPTKLQAAKTYNAAADHFDDEPLSFWDRAGRGTVARLALSLGATVLDVACGSGASALPAAEQVGPEGRVLAIDLAEQLLALGRTKAAARGLSQVTFELGDMERLDLPPYTFDAVICVFGIFFVSDMPRLAGALWRLVRPRGQLAVTTWGPRMFEPGSTLFWSAVQHERPELYRSFQPWDRLTDTAAVRRLLLEAGVAEREITITTEAGTQPLRSPEDFWTVALGSGYRGTIDQLEPEARERVRKDILDGLHEQHANAIETNITYAVAQRL